MVGQLDRSRARRRLSSLCSDFILEILGRDTGPSTSKFELEERYKSACIIAMGVSVEALTQTEIRESATANGRALSLFGSDISEIQKIRDDQCLSEAAHALIAFIESNRKSISEEDLGGVSELFSGHAASWTDDGIQLIHNPQRRGFGKIYTPYDVTDHICSKAVKRLISKAKSPEDLFRYRVLDPAVGSGAFCSQFVRIIWKAAKRKWKLVDESTFRARVCEEMIHACDIDEQALALCKVVLWISAGCPDRAISLNLSLGDSLAAGPCQEVAQWKGHTGLDCGNGYDVVLGNPPYVRVDPDLIGDFQTKSARNLFSAFSELSINLLNGSGLFCFIVPQSVIGRDETGVLRDFLFKQDCQLRFQIFDSVPDFLFDQGKIESNTNTNINQRTTVLTLDKSKAKSIFTSPLLRWRRTEERDLLFRSLKQVRIRQADLVDGAIPMLEDKEDLQAIRALSKVKTKISDAIGSDGRLLYIPKAVRYFITAIPIDLERPNTIELRVDPEVYHTVHITLNSNVFYWWWRVFGNGFQVDKRDVVSFPLLPIDLNTAQEYSNRLDDVIDDCRVHKNNAGRQVPNINYNFRQDLLQEIDALLMGSIGLKPHTRVLASKSNSLSGKMDALRGYNDPLAN